MEKTFLGLWLYSRKLFPQNLGASFSGTSKHLAEVFCTNSRKFSPAKVSRHSQSYWLEHVLHNRWLGLTLGLLASLIVDRSHIIHARASVTPACVNNHSFIPAPYSCASVGHTCIPFTIVYFSSAGPCPLFMRRGTPSSPSTSGARTLVQTRPCWWDSSLVFSDA